MDSMDTLQQNYWYNQYQIFSILAITSLWTKCMYVWMGLRTCSAPSANGSHTIHYEPKFVGFLREHNENWVCQESCARLRIVEN